MKKISLLFVDDEQSMQDAVRLYLEDTGEFLVDTLPSALKALEKLTFTQYDVIISDYLMPDMDAIAFIKELRRLENEIPVIIFTGRGCEEVAIDAFDFGADGYVQKGEEPAILFSRLINKIHQIIEKRHSAELLRQSEERFRRIFETFEDLYYQTDLDGTITLLSPSLFRLSGWVEDDLIGKPADFLYANPDDRTLFLTELFSQGSVRGYELRLKKRDGSVIWTAVSGSVLKNPDGSPAGVAGSIRDISEQKQNEQKLREIEERQRSYIRHAPYGVFVTDEAGYYRQVNPAACKITGYSEEELLTMRISDLLFPEDFPSGLTHFETLIRNDHSYGELPFRHKNGEQRWWSVAAEKITEQIYLAYCDDITARKRAEEELAHANNLIEGMLDGIEDVVALQHPDHTIIRYNKAGYQLLGMNPADVIGKKCFELIGRESPCDLCATSRALESKTVERIEKFVPEVLRYFECTSSPVLNSKGEVERIVELLHDISERKKMEESVRQSNQKLRLLTGLTRHDVSNKLAAIQLLNDLASEESDPGKRAEYFFNIKQAIEQIESIIRFTREYENFGVVASRWQQVESFISYAAAETVHSGVPVETTITSEIQIFADPIIQKVFSTLIENAVRHGGELTGITFSCLNDDRQLVIVCEDDGCGIPYEEKERIFDHGYGKNTGLGLFLAQEILAITGLSIRETGEPGRGARFEILVPEGKWRREES